MFFIASGAPKEKHLETDEVRTEALGNAAEVNFVGECFRSEETYFDWVKKSKLKTMDNGNKTITSSQSKVGSLVSQYPY